MLRLFVLVLTCLLPVPVLLAQAPTALAPIRPDSIGSASPVFVKRLPVVPIATRPQRPIIRALLAPVLLLSAGAMTTEKVELFETDEGVRGEIREHWARPFTQIDNQLRYLPGVVTVGLGLAGVRGRHTSVNQVLLGALAFTLNDALTSNVKKLTQVERPDHSNFHSFPSQHTSVAFAAATFLHKEYGQRSVWYSIGGYSVAAATGSLRMAKDVHWLSDVLAGAGIGIFSTEVAYWLYPRVQRQLQKITGNQRLIVLPSYQGGAAGATMVLVL